MNENIRKRLDYTTEDNLQDLMNSDYEDSLCRGYTGKVVNNIDPEKLGRCRIRVFGIFTEEVVDDDLPWALPEFSFRGSKVGSFVIPPVDAIVRVYFDCGEIYLPIYTTKVIDTANMPTQKDTDYPDNMVMFETDDGDYFTINRKSKVTTYNHNSGTKVIIKKDGTVEMTIVKDEIKEVKGKQEITSPSVKIDGTKVEITGGQLTVQGTVAPTGTGPFCGLPSCVITGAPHVGPIVLNT